jgi:hypothetical protein
MTKKNMKKITEYFHLWARPIASMVDYIWWLSDYDPDREKRFLDIFRSDNGSYRQYQGLTMVLDYHSQPIITISCSYMGRSVPIARINKTNITWQSQYHRDIYGKWLVILRDRLDLFHQLIAFFVDYWLINPYLTRYDHCVDTIHTGWDKMARIVSKKEMVRNSRTCGGRTTYVSYGLKRSSHFFRIYDKNLDLDDSWHSWLYPQYEWLHILRYEIQVTSKWIAQEDKKITWKQLIDIAQMNYSLRGDLRQRKWNQIFHWLRDTILNIRREASIDDLIWLRSRLYSQIKLIDYQIETFYFYDNH